MFGAILFAIAFAVGLGHPVDTLIWSTSTQPECVPCKTQPDGMLAGNGDLGVVLGGDSGGLNWELGKNDFWGIPGPVMWHGSFQHLSVGSIRLSSSFGANFTDYAASMVLRNGSLQSSASGGGFELRAQTSVVTDPETGGGGVLITARALCPAGRNEEVDLDLDLSTDNAFNVPVEVGELFDGGTRNGMWLRKANQPTALHTPKMVPCDANSSLVYNALRTFTIDDESGEVRVVNGSDSSTLCLTANESGELFGSACTGDNQRQRWVLVSGHLQSVANRSGCVVVRQANSSCPAGSYPAQPAEQGCKSARWPVALGECSHTSPTLWVPDGTFLRLSSLPSAEAPLCLAVVPPSVSNEVGVAVIITGAQIGGGRGSKGVNATSLLLKVKCNSSFEITVGAVTERDIRRSGGSPSSELQDTVKFAHYAVADPLATNATHRAYVAAAHERWWTDFWSKSQISLGREWTVLQRFYYTQLYLLRSSTRTGAVAPALWGPWSTTDLPAWADDMTLDYNFEANFWSSATANHPELIRPYISTVWEIMVPLARQRAALADWSQGGWPDVYGAEVMGMGCGVLKDWDRVSGCPKGFGGFRGLEMSSATGPFQGMAIFMDDGTRFVGGLAATPFVQYFESTQDLEFLRSVLFPYLRDVAAFYESYKVEGKSGQGHCTLPFTCAQEICAGSHGEVEHNAHQDLAVARMAVQKLLQYASGSYDGLNVTVSERRVWEDALRTLPPLPVDVSADGSVVFAEAEVPKSAARKPGPLSNAAYPITHLAAVWPAGVVSLEDTPSDGGGGGDDDESRDAASLASIGRSTVLALGNATSWAPGNGYVLLWPAAARLALTEAEASMGAGGLLTGRFFLERATESLLKKTKANGSPDLGGGWLEEMGAIEAIHSLLLQHHQGFLRIFPSWPREVEQAVSFADLRASGAFLVTAALSGTAVDVPVRIHSEAGRSCAVINPWPGRDLCANETSADGDSYEAIATKTASTKVSFDTKPGGSYIIFPC